MKIALISLGCVIGLIAIVAVIGMLLPEKHTASRQARYRQTPEALWTAITNYKGDPTLQYKIEASDPPRRFVTRVIDTQHNFGGAWTWEITPAAGGSALRITENGEVYNPMFRFISRFIIGHTGSIDSALKSIAAQFQENIQIED
jgi:hypothetical protein